MHLLLYIYVLMLVAAAASLFTRRTVILMGKEDTIKAKKIKLRAENTQTTQS